MSDRDKIIKVIARAIAADEDMPFRAYADLYRLSARAILTALDAAGMAVVPGWQPIETAPNDGTRILANCGTEYQPPWAVRVLLWYDALQWEGEYGPDSGWIKDLPDETTDAEFTEHDPSHWMPLPDPPASKETER